MPVTCGNRDHKTFVVLDAPNASGACAEYQYLRGTYQHEDAAAVRQCFTSTVGPLRTLEEQWQDEQDYYNSKSELAAEMAVERYFEEGPNGPEDDPQERALWALEDAMRPTNSHTL